MHVGPAYGALHGRYARIGGLDEVKRAFSCFENESSPQPGIASREGQAGSGRLDTRLTYVLNSGPYHTMRRWVDLAESSEDASECGYACLLALAWRDGWGVHATAAISSKDAVEAGQAVGADQLRRAGVPSAHIVHRRAAGAPRDLSLRRPCHPVSPPTIILPVPRVSHPHWLDI
jgi:hypothetical protein